MGAAERGALQGEDPERVAGASAPDVQTPSLARTVEALLFLSADPLTPAELAAASRVGEGAVLTALALLAEDYAPGRRGITLRELGGGWTLASDPAAEDAARRLLSRPRRPRHSRSSPTCSRSPAPRSRASVVSAPTRRPRPCSSGG
jgi:hypothetical protein